MLRKLLDFVLAIAILAAVGVGVYYLGRQVDNTSNNLAKHDSELGDGPVVKSPKAHSPSHHTVEWVVISVTTVAGVMLLVTFGGALVRTNRRQRWRAP
jgi:hypothetical protein